VIERSGKCLGKSERAAVSVTNVASKLAPRGKADTSASLPGKNRNCGGTGSRLYKTTSLPSLRSTSASPNIDPSASASGMT